MPMTSPTGDALRHIGALWHDFPILERRFSGSNRRALRRAIIINQLSKIAYMPIWRPIGPSFPVLRQCRGIWYDSTAKSYKVLTFYNMDMRSTRVYSITMPPDLARKAERLARKKTGP